MATASTEVESAEDDPLGLQPTAAEREAAALRLKKARDAYEAALPQLRTRWLAVLRDWARAPEDGAVRAQALQLSRQGVPPALRGPAWFRAVGNALGVTQELYETCVARAETTTAALRLDGGEAAAAAAASAASTVAASPSSSSIDLFPAQIDDDDGDSRGDSGTGGAGAEVEADPDEDAVAPPMLCINVAAKFLTAGPLPSLATPREQWLGRLVLGAMLRNRTRLRRLAIQADGSVRALAAALQEQRSSTALDATASLSSSSSAVASESSSKSRRGASHRFEEDDGGAQGIVEFKDVVGSPRSPNGAAAFVVGDSGEPPSHASRAPAAEPLAVAPAVAAVRPSRAVLLFGPSHLASDLSPFAGFSAGFGSTFSASSSSASAAAPAAFSAPTGPVDRDEDLEAQWRRPQGASFSSAKAKAKDKEGSRTRVDTPSDMATVVLLASSRQPQPLPSIARAEDGTGAGTSAGADTDAESGPSALAQWRRQRRARLSGLGPGASSSFVSLSPDVFRAKGFVLLGYEASVAGLGADLARTFPEYQAFFQPGSFPRQQLQRVLSAYAFFRPDHGYVQGMSHLAAVVILTLGALAPDERDERLLRAMRARGGAVSAAEDAAVFSWRSSALVRTRAAEREQQEAEAMAARAEAELATARARLEAIAAGRPPPPSVAVLVAGANFGAPAPAPLAGTTVAAAVSTAAVVAASASAPAFASASASSWLPSFLGGSATAAVTLVPAPSEAVSLGGEVFVPSGRGRAAQGSAAGAVSAAAAAAEDEATALPPLPSEVLVFMCFTNIMARAPLRWLASRSHSRLDAWYGLFEAVVVRTCPRLAFHLRTLGVQPNLYLVSWLLTLFSKPLGLEAAARLWDFVLIGGHAEVLRCCVGLLRHLEPRLLGRPFERVMRTLTKVPADMLNTFALCAAVEAVKFTGGEMSRLAALDQL